MKDSISKPRITSNHRSQEYSTFSSSNGNKQPIVQKKSSAPGLSAQQIAQMKRNEEGKAAPTDENPISRFHSLKSETGYDTNTIQKKENHSGLPDNLKSGIENLSGYSMDDVKVNYNSSKPAELQAHAYAQGKDIHLASGQEQHLPHEAWHVVQQKQGRVQPTIQMKGKVDINDDTLLEQEADVMGQKALANGNNTSSNNTTTNSLTSTSIDSTLPTQRRVIQRQYDPDVEIAKAVTLKDQALVKIAAAKFDEAKEKYDAVKLITKEIYTKNSQGKDKVYNRHLDAISLCLKQVVDPFVAAITTKYDEVINFYTTLFTQNETAYNTIYNQIAAKLLAREDTSELSVQLKALGKKHSTDFETKKPIAKEIADFNILIKDDATVKYPSGAGESEVPNSVIKTIDVSKIQSISQKNIGIFKQYTDHTKEIKKTTDAPDNNQLKDVTGILLLAGSVTRKDAIAPLVDNDVAKQVSIFTQINKHHRADDIADVVALINAIGVDKLVSLLALIDAIGAKGTIKEIETFYEVSKTVKGNPTVVNLTTFITEVEFESFKDLSEFVKEVGKHGNLETIKPIWIAAATNKNIKGLLELFKDGAIPVALAESSIAIATAYSGKTGKSKAEDWSAILKVTGWENVNLIALALEFDKNDGNQKVGLWTKVAQKDPTLQTKPDEIRATARLNGFANEEWYEQTKISDLSSTDRSKKKYTQLLYALLGENKLDKLETFDLSTVRGDFLSMLVFFHRHIASFSSSSGQGFDREGKGGGKYARSNKDHALNEQYSELLLDEGIDVSQLLQPLNSSLLGLQGNGKLSKGGTPTSKKSGAISYKVGGISLASAGLPSHNLKLLQDQQSIVGSSRNNKTAREKFFNNKGLVPTEGSRVVGDNATVSDTLIDKQKTALSDKVTTDPSYENFHDGMLQDRGDVVTQISTVINTITGGSVLEAIGSEGHPSLLLKIPTALGKYCYNGISTYKATKELVPLMAAHFNAAPKQEVKITERGSFGFQRPTIADTGDSVRLWLGYAPIESLLPGLKALVEKIRNTNRLTKIDDLTNLKTDNKKPLVYVEALKTAMRHSFIALNKKIDNGASAEKKRVYEWLKTRILIKLQQSGILLSKVDALYADDSVATQADKNKHFLVTADMTDKLQEYTMLCTAATLDNTVNPNSDHTKTGKFKDGTDTYEKKVVSKLGATDYRIYYLDSGEQALITAGILANRFEQGKDETDSNVPESEYISRNPYFEIGLYKGDKRSNLNKTENGKIVHADLSPVITSDIHAPKPKTDTEQEVKRTWQKPDGRLDKKDVIPIIDITNSSIDDVVNLGAMPDNFIIVESLTKHAQLGADKFIMGRLIAVSNKEGTKGVKALDKSNFLDLSQKIVGPVANEAYNPLLTQIRSNMDKALYTDELV